MRCSDCIESMSSENNTDANKQNLKNNYNNLNPFMMGMDLWQNAAMSWIATYNELVKNASKMSEYWFNLFWSRWSTINEKQDKVKVE
jgi:hypothetical protein